MNILLFSPIPSHPNYHGHRKRIYNLAKYLQSIGHHIHFVYFNEDPIKDCDCTAMSKEWTTFTLILREKSCDLRHGNYDFDECYFDDIAAPILKIIDLFHIDLVWMNYIWQSKLLEYIPKNILKVIDTHDKFTDRYKVLGNNGEKTYSWFSCSKEDEGKYLNRADIVVAIQEEEASYFKTISISKVYTVGHIEQKHNLKKKYTSLKKVGFLGAHNTINEIAIVDFLNEFYSSSKYSNEIEIIIAGKIADKITIKHENLKLLGLVEHLDDFYSEVDLVINPLLFGTGLKIKTAEALAYGVPIISSVVGFEGIESDLVYHKSENSKEMVQLLDKVYEDASELIMLEEVSKYIFKKYRDEMLLNIDYILNLQKPNLKQIDSKLLELYQELQNEKIKHITLKSDEYLKLMKNLGDISTISTIRQPLKKFKAYKDMLKTYRFFKNRDG